MSKKISAGKVMGVVVVVFMLWVIGSVMVESTKLKPENTVVSDDRTICEKLNDQLPIAFMEDVKEKVKLEKAGEPEPEDSIRRSRDIVIRMRQNKCSSADGMSETRDILNRLKQNSR